MDEYDKQQLDFWQRGDELLAEVAGLNATLTTLLTYQDKLTDALVQSDHACNELRALLADTQTQIHQKQEQLRLRIAEWDQLEQAEAAFNTSRARQDTLARIRNNLLATKHPRST